MSVVWKLIPGYPGYEASSLGEIRNAKTHNMLKQVLPPAYYKVHLSLPGTKAGRAQVSVHKLVALAFHENPENKRLVAHNNNDHLDNSAENLRWATQVENVEDQRIHGTAAIGSRHGSSKLDERIVLEIRDAAARMQQQGVKGWRRVLAKQYAIHEHTVTKVVNHVSWRHV